MIWVDVPLTKRREKRKEGARGAGGERVPDVQGQNLKREKGQRMGV